MAPDIASADTGTPEVRKGLKECELQTQQRPGRANISYKIDQCVVPFESANVVGFIDRSTAAILATMVRKLVPGGRGLVVSVD